MLKGGSFIVSTSTPHAVFTPEQFTDEQRQIAQLCREFLDKEVFTQLNAIDRQEAGLMPGLLEKTGELGLLGAAFPEVLGGLGEDFVTATLINESLGSGHSFAVAMAAHNGIGSLPILYFGTEAQKQRYIPKLASGEWKSAYALTEPGSGSDALAAKTTATPSDDGKSYSLNGQKIWITNAGFADVFTVFAKVNGKDFTAFIVEKGTPGLSLGEEEHKMGIKGSSTRPVFFENCVIPAENMLGQQGKGHLIAFNILNIGRLKLCAATMGGAKRALENTVAYAATREQFGRPIAQYGAIRQKLGEMVVRCYVTESALYRTAAHIRDFEQQLSGEGKSESEAMLGAAEEFAIECAMLKVAGSECLDYCVDEGVQVHGGNGYMEDYDITRAYRDSRINRIFEGTNEINRLLTVDMLLKRALKGRLDLMTSAMAVQKELMAIPDFLSPEGPFGETVLLLQKLKKAALLTMGAAVQSLIATLEEEQEILLAIADMLIDIYQGESALLRAMQMHESSHERATLAQDAATVFINDAADRIARHARNALQAFAQGDELRMALMGVKRFTRTGIFNAKDARRRLSDAALNAGGYPFG